MKKKKILFFRENKAFGFLSNFFPVKIKIDGIIYKSTEHYYQSQKFEEDKIKNEIMSAPDAATAYRLTKKYRKEVRKNWDSIKYNIMKKAIIAKFTQNEELKNLLIETGDCTLIEQSKNDY